MRSWQRFSAVLVLTVAGVEGLDFVVKCGPLPCQASRFVRYYEAFGKTDSLSSWQRFMWSWAFSEKV